MRMLYGMPCPCLFPCANEICELFVLMDHITFYINSRLLRNTLQVHLVIKLPKKLHLLVNFRMILTIAHGLCSSDCFVWFCYGLLAPFNENFYGIMSGNITVIDLLVPN